MEDLVYIGPKDYGLYLALLLVSRSMDFLSTWVATPNLVLEANPLARWLGWKWSILVNIVLCLAFALWPLPAIVLATTSVLVAARNFQSAWLMRALGEESYRNWVSEQLEHAPVGLYLFCLSFQSLLVGAVGLALVFWSDYALVPFAVGLGIFTYAVTVTFYSLLSVWRIRRSYRLSDERTIVFDK